MVSTHLAACPIGWAWLSCFVLLLGAQVAGGQGDAAGTDKKTRVGPLGSVERVLYLKHPEKDAGWDLEAGYIGFQGLERYEVRNIERSSDFFTDHMVRYSKDNGRTWSPWTVDEYRKLHREPDFAWLRWSIPYDPICYDPQSKRMVQVFLHAKYDLDPKTGRDTAYYYHSMWRMSADNGRTWSDGRMLRITNQGPDYDPGNLRNPDFLKSNHSYVGYNIIPLRDGGVATLLTASGEITNEEGQKETVDSIYCFVGHWDHAAQTYVWQHYGPFGVSKQVSSRGLMEPAIAQLKDGRLFASMRGSSTDITPGRCWTMTSSDEGRTWTKITDLRYDTGEPFYSPSAYSRLIRHSRTGKLYWIGNITPEPPKGNLPRYPLVIAEVDETKPALKKSTVTVIDDWDPVTQPDPVQYSNFALLENRETHNFELYLAHWGDGRPGWLNADLYRYNIRLKR